MKFFKLKRANSRSGSPSSSENNSTHESSSNLSSSHLSSSHTEGGGPSNHEVQVLAEVCNKMAPFPPDEEARIQKLLSYNVLDTEAEQEFDELTELASAICGTPIAIISLVAQDRQWFKSRVGLPAPETSREAAFCSYTILDKTRVMVVPNALEDDRFSHNELVLGFPNIRFYAGAPLVTPDGYALGTLCAIDTKPREFDDSQKRALQILSHQVVAQLEVHKHVEEMKKTIKQLQDLEVNLRIAKEFAEISSVSSFENLLLSQVGVQTFKAFLEEEFCAENLELWTEIKTFREGFPSRSKEDNSAEVSRIYETYINHGSVKQVNLNSDTTADIHTKITYKSFDITLFDQARLEAFENMKKDSYARFLNSKHYRELMNTVRHIGFVRLQAEQQRTEAS